MNFIQKDITPQRNSITSNSTSNSYYSGGESGVMTNLGYLELVKTSTNIANGIILKDTVDNTFGGVTGEKATYLLHTTTGETNEGWIFGTKESTTGLTTNVASLNGAGFLTIKGLNITNGNQSVNLMVDSAGELYIDKSVYSAGDIIAFSNDGDGGGSDTGGLIQQVFSYSNLLNANENLFSDDVLTDSFNAYTGYKLFERIKDLESGSTTSIVNNGSGNAITSLNKVGNIITVNSDLSFSQIGHNHLKTDLVDFPTALSEFSNDLNFTQMSNLTSTYIPKWNGSKLAKSQITDDGDFITINNTGTQSAKLKFSGSRPNAKVYYFENGVNLISNGGFSFRNISDNTIPYYVDNNDSFRITSPINSTTISNGALVVDGGVGIAKNVVVGGTIKSTTYQSAIVTGTAPLIVASTTKVTNLNADLLDNLHLDDTKSGVDTTTNNAIWTANKIKNITDTKLDTSIISSVVPNYYTKWNGTGLTYGLISETDGKVQVASNLFANSLSIKNGLKIINLTVDSVTGNLIIDGNVNATGDVVAFGIESGGGTGGGLIETVYSYANLLTANDSTYLDTNLTDTINAFSVYQLKKRIATLEGGSATTINLTGTGNAITSISKSGNTITANSAINFASTSYVDSAISNLIGGAPESLNTLKEIATSLNDDTALSSTLINSIANKANQGTENAYDLNIDEYVIADVHLSAYSDTAAYAINAGSSIYATYDANGKNISSSYLKLTGGTLTGILTGTSFKISNGTVSQFLKADGSLDSTSYVTTGQASTQIVGNTTNRLLKIWTNEIETGASANYIKIDHNGIIHNGTANFIKPFNDNNSLKISNASGTSFFEINSFRGSNSDGYNIFIGGGGKSSLGETGATQKGSYNTFIGIDAGKNNTSGNNLVFIGQNAGFINTSGILNVFVGQNSGYNNTTGDNNTFIGVASGFNNKTGNSNLFLGHNSGRFIENGSTNLASSLSVFLGKDIRAKTANGTNEIIIGYNTIGNGSNTATLGNDSITDTYLKGNVLIGTTINSGEKLQVNGSFKATSAYFTNNAYVGSVLSVNEYINAGSSVNLTNVDGETIINFCNDGNIQSSIQSGNDLSNFNFSSIYTTNFVIGGVEKLSIYNNGVTVTGNLISTGEITAYSTSDIRLKENIQPITNGLEIINKLNPVNYNWNSTAKELNPNKTDKTDSGLIAQELEKVLPNVVNNMYEGQYLGVDYIKLIPYLINSIQELTTEINKLKNK